MLHQLDEYKPDLTVPTATNIDQIISGIAKDEKSIYEQALINFVVKEHNTFDICETQGATQDRFGIANFKSSRFYLRFRCSKTGTTMESSDKFGC